MFAKVSRAPRRFAMLSLCCHTMIVDYHRILERINLANPSFAANTAFNCRTRKHAIVAPNCGFQSRQNLNLRLLHHHHIGESCINTGERKKILVAYVYGTASRQRNEFSFVLPGSRECYKKQDVNINNYRRKEGNWRKSKTSISMILGWVSTGLVMLARSTDLR